MLTIRVRWLRTAYGARPGEIDELPLTEAVERLIERRIVEWMDRPEGV